jgi:opacity protein-like surface antigen
MLRSVFPAVLGDGVCPSRRRSGSLALRKGAISGGAALIMGLLASSGAAAECANNFANPGGFDVSPFLPFGQGGSVNSLVSVINTVNTAFLTNTTAFVSAPGGPKPDQQGGGAWGRVIAGTVENQNTGVTTIDTTPLGFTTTGVQTCHTTTRQNYTGFQVGHDISILNGGNTGANWHIGFTAGYFEANAKDISAPPPDPTFSGNFQVPFVGVYTAYTKGNFFADGQLRWDFYQSELSDAANGLFGQHFDARGISVTGNFGYRFDLPSKWFIEPSAGAVWSRVKVDPLNVSGTLVLQNSPFVAFPGTVQVDDIDSLLGRLSVRIGTNFTSGNIAYQPFFTASVLHEFAGDVTTRQTTNFDAGCAILGIPPPCGPDITGTLTTSRVGTYGQFALGSAFQIVNTGWVGYGRVDYRIGDNIEGISVNAGLRYQFTPDQPARGGLKDGPAPVAWRPYNWTGPYIGGFAGATWGGQDWFTPVLDTHDHPRFAGYLVGGQTGYNLQRGRWVVGIEGDYGFSNAHGARSCDDNGGPAAFFFTCEAEVHRLASLTGRLGYTWERALFYVKGGLAAGQVTVQTSVNTQNEPILGFGVPLLDPFPPVNGTTKWLTGWTIGGGMEFALTNKWSAKAEYMFYDLGSADFAIDPPLVADAKTHGSIARIGVNYHLGR